MTEGDVLSSARGGLECSWESLAPVLCLSLSLSLSLEAKHASMGERGRAP
jgi:hypothetical protein